MSMERIVELSAAARTSGMTYGQYVALHGTVPPPPKRHIPSYLQPYVRRCERCGQPLNFKNARKYCDACRPLAAAESRRDAAQRRKSGGL